MKYKLLRAATVSESHGFVEPLLPSLTQKYEIQLLSSSGDKLDNLCREYHVKGHRVEMYRRMSPLKDIKSLYQLVKVFRKEKPYMVHSMTPKAGLLCMLAAWMTGVPRRVHTFTGLVWPITTGVSRRILMFTDWLTCACATHVIPEGQGVLNDLQQHITQKPMKVLGYGNVRGVNMKQISRRKEIMEKAEVLKKEDVFTFIFVGRLVGDKGINELIEAFALLHDKYPHVRLLLIGPYETQIDPLKEETLKRIQDLAAIEALGPMYGDDLLAYYAVSDCFVFPSYREGFPNTVLEAGAMGLPSIVTDINGSREIIVHGENGVIIPSKDTQSLQLAMEQMLIDNEKRTSMASKARTMIANRFEDSFVQKCLFDFYDEIIS